MQQLWIKIRYENIKTSQMKKLLFLFVLGILSSCASDRDIEVNVLLKYDDDPFVFFSDLTYPDGTAFRITNMNFFISEITVGDGQDSEVISDAEFLDLGKSHLDQTGAASGYSIIFGGIEDREISQVSFNVGLTEEQNGTVPSSYPDGHALSDAGTYWTDWVSYIQIKIEGFYDDDADGVADEGFNFHLGSNAIKTAVLIDNIADNDGVITLTLDIKDIFQNESEFHDLLSTPKIHNLSQVDEMTFLARNLAGAIEFGE